MLITLQSVTFILGTLVIIYVQLKTPLYSFSKTDTEVSNTTELEAYLNRSVIALALNELNVNQFKAEGPGFHQDTVYELASVKALAKDVPVKVIIEADLLSPDEIVQATKACIAAGVDFVKTSTGMVGGGHGASIEDVSLIAETLQSYDTTGEIDWNVCPESAAGGGLFARAA